MCHIFHIFGNKCFAKKNNYPENSVCSFIKRAAAFCITPCYEGLQKYFRKSLSLWMYSLLAHTVHIYQSLFYQQGIRMEQGGLSLSNIKQEACIGARYAISELL